VQNIDGQVDSMSCRSANKALCKQMTKKMQDGLRNSIISWCPTINYPRLGLNLNTFPSFACYMSNDHVVRLFPLNGPQMTNSVDENPFFLKTCELVGLQKISYNIPHDHFRNSIVLESLLASKGTWLSIHLSFITVAPEVIMNVLRECLHLEAVVLKCVTTSSPIKNFLFHGTSPLQKVTSNSSPAVADWIIDMFASQPVTEECLQGEMKPLTPQNYSASPYPFRKLRELKLYLTNLSGFMQNNEGLLSLPQLLRLTIGCHTPTDKPSLDIYNFMYLFRSSLIEFYLEFYLAYYQPCNWVELGYRRENRNRLYNIKVFMFRVSFDIIKEHENQFDTAKCFMANMPNLEVLYVVHARLDRTGKHKGVTHS